MAAQDNFITFTSLQCCGYKEISGLRYYRDRPEKALAHVMEHRYNRVDKLGCGAILFTESYNYMFSQKYASNFAKYLQDCALGTIYILPEFSNPNTGNTISSFIWYPDLKALDTWCKNNGCLPLPIPEY